MERLDCGGDIWFQRQFVKFKALDALQWDAYQEWDARRKGIEMNTTHDLFYTVESNGKRIVHHKPCRSVEHAEKSLSNLKVFFGETIVEHIIEERK